MCLLPRTINQKGLFFCKRGSHVTNSTAFSTCEVSNCVGHDSEFRHQSSNSLVRHPRIRGSQISVPFSSQQ
ncbi:hypothetical protein TELCIR_07534 [Teladorsagia circumcincta]|uniref:Uncharacterized protein n=1 Tax=Teladorsagia circumcincta TaxID=45464 RepID=A0A2G9UK57_TELCI|nr:hypothetical protein TELCIR_07534 [Teladorsagia circumcincta]